MKALFCSGKGVQFLQDYPDAKPLPGEMVLNVTHCGICDTDVQLAEGYMGFQGVLGHEFVGVDAEGNRYTAEINNACQNCDWCQRGLATHCPHRTVLGIFHHDGAMAQRVTVPMTNLHPVPDSISNLSAVFIEPLAAAFQILEQVSVGGNQQIAVLGDGKLGILCAWVLATRSDHVLLVGKHSQKLAIAGERVQTLLLDEALDSRKKTFDIVVDATGNVSGLEMACQLCKSRGTVVLKTTVQRNHDLNLASIVIDELTVIGSRCGPFAKAIEALSSQHFPVEKLIEAVYPFDLAESAFEHAKRKGAAKIILEMS